MIGVLALSYKDLKETLMECSEPGAIRDEELVACLMGETVPLAVMEHLAHCQYCSSRLATYRRIEFTLMSKLYRWDCPPNQVLGEYQMGLLSQEQIGAVKKHLDRCVLCVAELATLSAFLTNDPMLEPALMPQVIASQPSLAGNNHQPAQRAKRAVKQLREQSFEGAHRVMAALVPSQPHFAYQRGSQPALWPRRYEAEDVTISIQVERGTSRNDALQLIGFVTRKGMALETLQGIPVQLVPVAAGEKTFAVQTIDELGNFVFSSLAPDTYILELQFPEGIIVIDQIPVAMQE